MRKNRLIYPVAPILHTGTLLRRFRLIFLISFETIIFAILLLIFSPITQQVSIIGLTIVGILLSLSNLLVLKKYNCINVSGYLAVILTLVITLIGNLLIGGPDTSFFIWFFIIPVIASALVGLTGLVIFGSISTLIVCTYILIHPMPMYVSSEVLSWSVQVLNHSFLMLLIVTVLSTFLLENHAHEKQSLQLQQALEKDREKFYYLSKHDLLTDLPNRSYFYEALSTVIQKAKKNEVITVFYMDLNKLKLINDRYGHEVGDDVLIQGSKRLANCFREQDIVARIGGDEFTALVVHDKNDRIEKVLTHRIHKAFQHPFRGNMGDLTLSFSIGFASYPEEATDIEALISIADKRMYEEKKKLEKNNGVNR